MPFSTLITNSNIGMHSMQEVFFFLAQIEIHTLCHFQMDKNFTVLHLKRRKKNNLSEVTQVFCGLLSKYFKAYIKCIGATLTVVSLAAVVWSRYTMPCISYLRESALHDETK